jgi:hypothetical protein
VARDRVLRPREVAAVTGLSVGTLERLRRLRVWIEYAQTATALATIARQTVPGATGELLTGGVPSGET